MILSVQFINCVNDAGFVMSFGLRTMDDDLHEFTLDGVDSGAYPIDQARSLDLSTLGFSEGTAFRPEVRAILGVVNPGDRWVKYAKNGQTATYVVTGTTLIYSVRLQNPPPVGQPLRFARVSTPL
jgi:hypothetical protein